MGVVKTRSLAKLLRYREEIHESGNEGRQLRITKPKLHIDTWNPEPSGHLRNGYGDAEYSE